jgi:hypothetical protein
LPLSARCGCVLIPCPSKPDAASALSKIASEYRET